MQTASHDANGSPVPTLPAAPTRTIEIQYDAATIAALIKGSERALVFKDAEGMEILTRLAVILQRGMRS